MKQYNWLASKKTSFLEKWPLDKQQGNLWTPLPYISHSRALGPCWEVHQSMCSHRVGQNLLLVSWRVRWECSAKQKQQKQLWTIKKRIHLKGPDNSHHVLTPLPPHQGYRGRNAVRFLPPRVLPWFWNCVPSRSQWCVQWLQGKWLVLQESLESKYKYSLMY